MFESREKLEDEIRKLLAALRALGDGRYAALIEPRGVVFDDAAAEPPPPWPLRRFLEQRSKRLFAIPAALTSPGEVDEDVFADWADDGFFLVFVNGRVAVVVACPEPEALEKEAGKLVRVLVDRLVRYNTAWRADERGRGLFFSRPRLDTVVVSRAAAEGSEAG
ncbi:MAG: hypothetical protein PVJ73_04910 [Acidobacteriota bacterium]